MIRRSGPPKYLTVVPCLLVLAVGPSLHAEEPSIPATDITEMSIESLMEIKVDTVEGASKHTQRVTEAPSSVSIVTADDIRKYGYRTIADILASLRSFYVTYDHDYKYIGVRGFGRLSDYNNRILLLVDGHRTNDNSYNQAFIGTEAILDVDLIDRVEVIRGPGSSLYGSNAIFAVVNIITKRGKDFKGVEASAEAGSSETFKGRVSYGNTYQNGLDMVMSGTGYYSKGDNLYFREFDPAYSTDPRATNGGTTDNTDYDRSKSFFTKLSLADFTLTGAFSSRAKGVPTAAFQTDFNDPSNKTTDTRGYLDLKYEHSLTKDTDIFARLYYDYYEYDGDYPSYKLYGVFNKTQTNGEWWGSEVRVSSRFLDRHRIIVGGEYVDNFRQDHTNYDVNPYAVWDDSKRSSKVWAAYTQGEFTLLKNLVLNAGVRYDHYDSFGGTTNPRFALIYNLFEKSSVKLLYGYAFRAPTRFEANDTTSNSIAAPTLKPEKITTYELVYEQYIGEHFRMSTAGYYYRIADLISETETAPGSGVTYFTNIDSVNASGVELEVESRWENGFAGRASYTLQRTEDKLTGERLTNSPAQLAKLNLTVPLMKNKVFAGIEEQYTSKRKTQAGNYASDFFITNVTLFSHNILKNLELSGSVYNLFDKSHSDPGMEPPSPDNAVVDSIIQEGRSFRVKITYRF